MASFGWMLTIWSKCLGSGIGLMTQNMSFEKMVSTFMTSYKSVDQLECALCTDKEGEPFMTKRIWDYKINNIQTLDKGWYSCWAMNNHNLTKLQSGYVNVV